MPILAALAARLAMVAARGVAAEGTTAGESALAGSLLRAGIRYEAAEDDPENEEIEIPVHSEAISSIGYRSGTITVTFHRGGQRTYDYPGSKEEFIAFALAPSKGRFFNAHIRE